MSVQVVNAFEGKECDWVFQFLEEHESAEVSDLLSLLCCLGGVDISVRMILRASAPRIVWGSDGEKEGLFEPRLKIGSLASAVSTGDPVKSLISYGLVVREEASGGDETLSIDPSFMKSSEKLMAGRAFWNSQAVILVCHTFPRGRDLGVPYGVVGNQQLHVLRHVLKYFVSRNLEGTVSSYIQHLMAETLLAASMFSDVDWKRTALTITESILLADPNHYLISWLDIRQSKLSRIDTSIEGYDEDELAPVHPPERRSNALFMRHSLQTAQAAVEVNMYADALRILEDIKPLDSYHPSTMERMVLRDREFAIGRVYRFQGRFKEALECFQILLPSYVETNKSYYSLLSHISNTFVELGDASQAEKILTNASSADDIEDKHFQISLAEAKLHLRCFSEAENICEDLRLSHGAIKNPGMNVLMFNVRTLTVLARAAHLSGRITEALVFWEACLVDLKKLENIGWVKDGFTQMICWLSLADIKQKMGDLVEARQLKAKAEKILEAKGREHWVTGLGTIWLDAIRTSIEVTGTELALRTPERWWAAQIDTI